MVARFVFQLQSALDWRYRLEEQALAEQAAARNQYQLIEQKLHALEYEMVSAQQLPFPAAGADLLNRAVYLEHLKQKILACRRALREAERRLEEKTQLYLECRRKRQVLEKLKEKQYMQFCYNLQVQEQKRVDDLSGSRYWHKTRAGG